MKVTPIIAPAFDWQMFMTEAHAALKRSPTASMNMAGMKPGLLKTVIPALGEFQHEHTPAVPYLKSRESEQVLGHLHVSFLVEAAAETISRLLALARLNVITPDDCKTVAILSGSLRDWKDVVVANARLKAEPDVREVATAVHACLVKAGLGDLFAGCDARKHHDGTVVLEQKNVR